MDAEAPMQIISIRTRHRRWNVLEIILHLQDHHPPPCQQGPHTMNTICSCHKQNDHFCPLPQWRLSMMCAIIAFPNNHSPNHTVPRHSQQICAKLINKRKAFLPSIVRGLFYRLSKGYRGRSPMKYRSTPMTQRSVNTSPMHPPSHPPNLTPNILAANGPATKPSTKVESKRYLDGKLCPIWPSTRFCRPHRYAKGLKYYAPYADWQCHKPINKYRLIEMNSHDSRNSDAIYASAWTLFHVRAVRQGFSICGVILFEILIAY